jgi:hypothetical protein
MSGAIGFSVKDISKSKIQELFALSDSEYVDLLRDRPNKKDQYKYPFFRPLRAPLKRQGRGKGGFLAFMFVDFILLEIMITLKLQGMSRDCGVFLRRLFLTLMAAPFEKHENILSPDFSAKTKWTLKIDMDASGNQRMAICKDGAELSHKVSHLEIALKDENGLCRGRPQDFILDDSTFCLSIDLNKIHKKVVALYQSI